MSRKKKPRMEYRYYEVTGKMPGAGAAGKKNGCRIMGTRLIICIFIT